jgi:hypothetical protein
MSSQHNVFHDYNIGERKKQDFFSRKKKFNPYSKPTAELSSLPKKFVFKDVSKNLLLDTSYELNLSASKNVFVGLDVNDNFNPSFDLLKSFLGCYSTS